MSVSASAVLPRQIHGMFRQFAPALRVNRRGKMHRLVSSEGRGHRFESCRVRQFSAIFEEPSGKALALPFVRRCGVAEAFTRRSRSVYSEVRHG
jgi:hypothetical protein